MPSTRSGSSKGTASTDTASTITTPSLKLLQARLRGYQLSFNNICQFVENFKEGTTVIQVSVRLERIDEVWEKMSEIYCDIETHEEFEDEDEVFSKQRTDFENSYYDAKSFLLDKQKQLQAPTASIQPATAAVGTAATGSLDHVRLPQIKLQAFDGNIDEWLSFRDLFTSLIHWKTDLPDVEKFHYLKGCLEGEARALIEPLKITKANYQIAWDALLKRYNNNKLLKKRQVQALFKLPILAKESPSELHKLMEGFDRIVQTLDQIVQPRDYKDLLLVNILGSRLDPITRRGWEEFSSAKEQDTLKDLLEFLQRRVRVLESLPPRSVDGKQDPIAAAKKKPFQARVSHNAVQKFSAKCPACTESHWLYMCPTFQKMSVASRESFLRSNSLCRNCFKRGHQAKECSSRYSCRKCKGRHHTMVCFKAEREENPRDAPEETALTTSNNQRSSASGTVANTTTNDQVSSNVAQRRSSKILLATAVVLIENENGLRIPARALLDSGSECNFVSEKLCQQLRSRRERVDIAITGIGQAATKAKHRIQAIIKSRYSPFSRELQFIVLPKVTVDLPMALVDIKGWDIPDGFDLADPSFFRPGSVDLVIGIQAFFSFFKTGKEHSLGNGLPTLTESVFGWIVSGEVAEASPSSTTTTCNMAVTDRLDELLERFWSCEEVGNSNNYSVEESRCEEQFERTVKRGSDGRYTVTLPKQEGGLDQLGDSEEIAIKRLYGLERRLHGNLDLRRQYNDFMTEYITLGHMRKVDDDSQANVKRCFLPHHPVIKESSTTTKVRVVFDASCKTSSGTSLNDALLVGPIVQQDLRTIMLRGRIRQVMLVADVEKMFRQIDMDPTDTPLQSIKWRFGPNEEIGTYELTTVTYGTKPAPFLATRTLKQLAMDERDRFPLAAQSIDEDVYMDDVICGADNLDAAIDLRKQYEEMMTSGGFRLRKWASNCEAALDGVPSENLALADSGGINWDQDATVKTLGLTWLPRTDEFKFDFQLPSINSGHSLTKRIVTSIVARLFDPLGLLGACVVAAKIHLQELWDLIDGEGKQLGWDEELPATVGEKIQLYLQKLPCLNELRIQRCVLARGATSYEIHCFSDASERAYGACIYIRSTNPDGDVVVRLLTSKSRVAPRKLQTLPRLELCGALLSAQLLEKVVQALKVAINVYFWTDSTCVLMWLRAIPTVWVTFVANRVAKIQAITAEHSWHHVPGIINPADLISRGITPDTIGSNIMWWEGPSYLKGGTDQWPSQPLVSPDEAPERKKTVCTATQQQTAFSIDYISKYSSYMQLIRATAFWLRLIGILRSKSTTTSNFLGPKEVWQAELVLVRRVQQEAFSVELQALSEGKSVPRSSPLRWFNPVVGEDGTLRVGGRLAHSQESHETKHPMVLPARHPLTEMVLQFYHEELLHAGPQLLLASVRQRFWPLGGRNVARMVYHRCQRCFRAKPIVMQQQMGQLPSARVTACRPFLKTGVDFFGPVFTKAGRGRTAIKSYVSVFVCMSTKAVHLEHVSDLSTDSFLQALRRFIARRGRPSDIYSDNGTNFVGARNQLKELFELLKSGQHRESVTRECTKEGITWHFNPPSAPHCGGLWEAAVRSAKYHLLRVLGNSTVSSEDFNTLLVQVEGCLNSRPLTPLSDDPTDLQPLTPAHFLTGGPIQAIPDPDYSDVKLNRLNRWQLVQRQLQDFWTRWRKEYLAQLQARSKNWKSPVKVDIGMLVIIVDENQPPMRWKLGRIEQLHPGDDGIVRVVTVRTATGSLKRPVVKLCVLPTPESSADS